jgi:hypothetical protein
VTDWELLATITNRQPISHAATDLGIPEQTIRSWIRRGHLETSHYEGRMTVDRRAVQQRASKSTDPHA